MLQISSFKVYSPRMATWRGGGGEGLHYTGKVLAYAVGTRKDAEFLKLRSLLAPFSITRYYTNKAGVYQRHLPPAQHTVGS